MRTLNLGIVAHVDAGKTSLTERLLHAAGVIDEIGSVDDGSTQTDSLALERRRGITIRSAVVSFAVGGADGRDVTVNLIDTPGHPDFIAEVERVLGVLDGAVLVVSAVEGVQAQTRVLMRALRRLRIPTLIFVNKIDRAGAVDGPLLASMARRLSPDLVPMGRVRAAGTREAGFVAFAEPPDEAVAVLAEHDEELLAAYVGNAVTARQAGRVLREKSRKALVHPVFFGSAITGAGVPALIDALPELLPAAEGDPAGPVEGTVFKVERGPAGEKIAYLRLLSGTVRVRDRLVFHSGPEGKVTALAVFDRGPAARRDAAVAGQIAKVWGLADVRIGDGLGRPPGGGSFFAPPTLETVVVPDRPADRGAMHAALTRLAEQDPLINLRPSGLSLSLSLYGEVQKEVIQATLADEFGLGVSFRQTTTICIERPVGTGAALEVIAVAPNPFLATVGLRVEPGPIDSGVRFRLGVEPGSMPPAFFAAVAETVHEALEQGLHGWRVTDCAVTMTHSGYWARQSHAHGTFDKSMSSTAGDFRNLTPLVLMAALAEAGTVVYEPMHRFRLEIPADTLGQVLPALAKLGAIPEAPAAGVLTGSIPAARVHDLRQALPGLTRGEGVLESGFDRYQPVRGAVPERPRTDHNPLDRKEYLLHVVRRV